ncbi:MAG: domain S-box protein [Bacteroidetes bacterium]|jgi:PAS domain S-box-containing protein|nr:domain S-box protein [Bacteroidota bacterium]
MFAIDIQDQILDKLNTLIVVLNNDGSIDYVSKSAQHLLGYKSNELLGQNWWEVTRFSKPEGEQVKNKILGIFSNQNISTQTFEHELRTSMGGRKWIRWNVSYLNEDQLVGIGYDITDNKNNERRLIENNKQLLEQNKDITDSIYYAQRIQQSILKTPEQLRETFENSFLLYKPKDIVSGDYYWFYEDDVYKYLAVVDCTGHGVPGAMMSMVANSMFKEVFINRKATEPSEILKALDEELAKSINKNQDASFNDGMDVALIRIDKTKNELSFSGAFRSLLISRGAQITELKGSRYPIGFYSGVEKQFDTETFQLQENDSLYLFTDGFIDQFGGERNKKLNKSNFKELLSSITDMNMEEQEAFLEYAFNNWKQDNDQTDDVLVIGIKI